MKPYYPISADAALSLAKDIFKIPPPSQYSVHPDLRMGVTGSLVYGGNGHDPSDIDIFIHSHEMGHVLAEAKKRKLAVLIGKYFPDTCRYISVYGITFNFIVLPTLKECAKWHLATDEMRLKYANRLPASKEVRVAEFRMALDRALTNDDWLSKAVEAAVHDELEAIQQEIDANF